MARETKIGVALMVLLVGVFGFMVYKKWNSQQPAAIASAAETDSPATDSDEPPSADPMAADKRAAVPADAEGTTDKSAPIQNASTPIAKSDPFATATVAAAPPRQAEPSTAFADEPFVRSTPPIETARNDAASPAFTETPPSQAEPGAGEATSLFGDVETDPTASADPSSETPAATEVVSKTSTNPFASDPAVPTASAPAEQPSVEEKVAEPAPAKLENPFGDLAAETPAADASPPSFGESTAAAAETASTATARPKPLPDAGFEEPKLKQSKVELAPANASAEPDPFSESASTASPVATADEAPEKLFGDDEAAVPIAASADTPETPVRTPTPLITPATKIDIAGGPASPPAGSTPSSRPPYIVVAENDSYWTISKRVYGTSAYFHALAKFNAERIKEPNRLKPGMKVMTPDPQELAARFPNVVSQGATSSPSEESEKYGLSRDEQGRPIYRVDRSDTLTGIAQAHLGRAARWLQIYEMNKSVISDPKTLKPGTLLRLPPDASRVRLVPEG
jgi:nucleoid-associated protein YgaU